MRIKINHPLVDTISIITDYGSYSGANTSEIAFFWRGQWATNPIEPFTKYMDSPDCDNPVYTWVPNEVIDAFLDEYRA